MAYNKLDEIAISDSDEGDSSELSIYVDMTRTFQPIQSIINNYLSKCHLEDNKQPYKVLVDLAKAIKKCTEENHLMVIGKHIWHNVVQFLLAITINCTENENFKYDEKFILLKANIFADYVFFKCESLKKLIEKNKLTEINFEDETNSILQYLYIIFHQNIDFILLVLIRLKVDRTYNEVLFPIFSKICHHRVKTKYHYNILTYAIGIIVFKSWKKMAFYAKDKKLINEYLKQALPASLPAVDKHLKKFRTVLPVITKHKESNATSFFVNDNKLLDPEVAANKLFGVYQEYLEKGILTEIGVFNKNENYRLGVIKATRNRCVKKKMKRKNNSYLNADELYVSLSDCDSSNDDIILDNDKHLIDNNIKNNNCDNSYMSTNIKSPFRLNNFYNKSLINNSLDDDYNDGDDEDDDNTLTVKDVSSNKDFISKLNSLIHRNNDKQLTIDTKKFDNSSIKISVNNSNNNDKQKDSSQLTVTLNSLNKNSNNIEIIDLSSDDDIKNNKQCSNNNLANNKFSIKNSLKNKKKIYSQLPSTSGILSTLNSSVGIASDLELVKRSSHSFKKTDKYCVTRCEATSTTSSDMNEQNNVTQMISTTNDQFNLEIDSSNRIVSQVEGREVGVVLSCPLDDNITTSSREENLVEENLKNKAIINLDVNKIEINTTSDNLKDNLTENIKNMEPIIELSDSQNEDKNKPFYTRQTSTPNLIDELVKNISEEVIKNVSIESFKENTITLENSSNVLNKDDQPHMNLVDMKLKEIDEQNDVHKNSNFISENILDSSNSELHNEQKKEINKLPILNEEVNIISDFTKCNEILTNDSLNLSPKDQTNEDQSKKEKLSKVIDNKCNSKIYDNQKSSFHLYDELSLSDISSDEISLDILMDNDDDIDDIVESEAIFEKDSSDPSIKYQKSKVKDSELFSSETSKCDQGPDKCVKPDIITTNDASDQDLIDKCKKELNNIEQQIAIDLACAKNPSEICISEPVIDCPENTCEINTHIDSKIIVSDLLNSENSCTKIQDSIIILGMNDKIDESNQTLSDKADKSKDENYTDDSFDLPKEEHTPETCAENRIDASLISNSSNEEKNIYQKSSDIPKNNHEEEIKFCEVESLAPTNDGNITGQIKNPDITDVLNESNKKTNSFDNVVVTENTYSTSVQNATALDHIISKDVDNSGELIKSLSDDLKHDENNSLVVTTFQDEIIVELIKDPSCKAECKSETKPSVKDNKKLKFINNNKQIENENHKLNKNKSEITVKKPLPIISIKREEVIEKNDKQLEESINVDNKISVNSVTTITESIPVTLNKNTSVNNIVIIDKESALIKYGIENEVIPLSITEEEEEDEPSPVYEEIIPLAKEVETNKNETAINVPELKDENIKEIEDEQLPLKSDVVEKLVISSSNGLPSFEEDDDAPLAKIIELHKKLSKKNKIKKHKKPSIKKNLKNNDLCVKTEIHDVASFPQTSDDFLKNVGLERISPLKNNKLHLSDKRDLNKITDVILQNLNGMKTKNIISNCDQNYKFDQEVGSVYLNTEVTISPIKNVNLNNDYFIEDDNKFNDLKILVEAAVLKPNEIINCNGWSDNNKISIKKPMKSKLVSNKKKYTRKLLNYEHDLLPSRSTRHNCTIRDKEEIEKNLLVADGITKGSKLKVSIKKSNTTEKEYSVKNENKSSTPQINAQNTIWQQDQTRDILRNIPKTISCLKYDDKFSKKNKKNTDMKNESGYETSKNVFSIHSDINKTPFSLDNRLNDLFNHNVLITKDALLHKIKDKVKSTLSYNEQIKTDKLMLEGLNNVKDEIDSDGVNIKNSQSVVKKRPSRKNSFSVKRSLAETVNVLKNRAAHVNVLKNTTDDKQTCSPLNNIIVDKIDFCARNDKTKDLKETITSDISDVKGFPVNDASMIHNTCSLELSNLNNENQNQEPKITNVKLNDNIIEPIPSVAENSSLIAINNNLITLNNLDNNELDKNSKIISTKESLVIILDETNLTTNTINIEDIKYNKSIITDSLSEKTEDPKTSIKCDALKNTKTDIKAESEQDNIENMDDKITDDSKPKEYIEDIKELITDDKEDQQISIKNINETTNNSKTCLEIIELNSSVHLVDELCFETTTEIITTTPEQIKVSETIVDDAMSVALNNDNIILETSEIISQIKNDTIPIEICNKHPDITVDICSNTVNILTNKICEIENRNETEKISTNIEHVVKNEISNKEPDVELTCEKESINKVVINSSICKYNETQAFLLNDNIASDIIIDVENLDNEEKNVLTEKLIIDNILSAVEKESMSKSTLENNEYVGKNDESNPISEILEEEVCTDIIEIIHEINVITNKQNIDDVKSKEVSTSTEDNIEIIEEKMSKCKSNDILSSQESENNESVCLSKMIDQKNEKVITTINTLNANIIVNENNVKSTDTNINCKINSSKLIPVISIDNLPAISTPCENQLAYNKKNLEPVKQINNLSLLENPPLVCKHIETKINESQVLENCANNDNLNQCNKDITPDSISSNNSNKSKKNNLLEEIIINGQVFRINSVQTAFKILPRKINKENTVFNKPTTLDPTVKNCNSNSKNNQIDLIRNCTEKVNSEITKNNISTKINSYKETNITEKSKNNTNEFIIIENYSQAENDKEIGMAKNHAFENSLDEKDDQCNEITEQPFYELYEECVSDNTIVEKDIVSVYNGQHEEIKECYVKLKRLDMNTIPLYNACENLVSLVSSKVSTNEKTLSDQDITNNYTITTPLYEDITPVESDNENGTISKEQLGKRKHKNISSTSESELSDDSNYNRNSKKVKYIKPKQIINFNSENENDQQFSSFQDSLKHLIHNDNWDYECEVIRKFEILLPPLCSSKIGKIFESLKKCPKSPPQQETLFRMNHIKYCFMSRCLLMYSSKPGINKEALKCVLEAMERLKGKRLRNINIEELKNKYKQLKKSDKIFKRSDVCLNLDRFIKLWEKIQKYIFNKATANKSSSTESLNHVGAQQKEINEKVEMDKVTSQTIENIVGMKKSINLVEIESLSNHINNSNVIESVNKLPANDLSEQFPSFLNNNKIENILNNSNTTKSNKRESTIPQSCSFKDSPIFSKDSNRNNINLNSENSNQNSHSTSNSFFISPLNSNKDISVNIQVISTNNSEDKKDSSSKDFDIETINKTKSLLNDISFPNRNLNIDRFDETYSYNASTNLPAFDIANEVIPSNETSNNEIGWDGDDDYLLDIVQPIWFNTSDANAMCTGNLNDTFCQDYITKQAQCQKKLQLNCMISGRTIEDTLEALSPLIEHDILVTDQSPITRNEKVNPQVNVKGVNMNEILKNPFKRSQLNSFDDLNYIQINAANAYNFLSNVINEKIELFDDKSLEEVINDTGGNSSKLNETIQELVEAQNHSHSITISPTTLISSINEFDLIEFDPIINKTNTNVTENTTKSFNGIIELDSKNLLSNDQLSISNINSQLAITNCNNNQYKKIKDSKVAINDNLSIEQTSNKTIKVVSPAVAGSSRTSSPPNTATKKVKVYKPFSFPARVNSKPYPLSQHTPTKSRTIKSSSNSKNVSPNLSLNKSPDLDTELSGKCMKTLNPKIKLLTNELQSIVQMPTIENSSPKQINPNSIVNKNSLDMPVLELESDENPPLINYAKNVEPLFSSPLITSSVSLESSIAAHHEISVATNICPTEDINVMNKKNDSKELQKELSSFVILSANSNKNSELSGTPKSGPDILVKPTKKPIDIKNDMNSYINEDSEEYGKMEIKQNNNINSNSNSNNSFDNKRVLNTDSDSKYIITQSFLDNHNSNSSNCSSSSNSKSSSNLNSNKQINVENIIEKENNINDNIVNANNKRLNDISCVDSKMVIGKRVKNNNDELFEQVKNSEINNLPLPQKPKNNITTIEIQKEIPAVTSVNKSSENSNKDNVESKIIENNNKTVSINITKNCSISNDDKMIKSSKKHNKCNNNNSIDNSINSSIVNNNCKDIHKNNINKSQVKPIECTTKVQSSVKNSSKSTSPSSSSISSKSVYILNKLYMNNALLNATKRNSHTNNNKDKIKSVKNNNQMLKSQTANSLTKNNQLNDNKYATVLDNDNNTIIIIDSPDKSNITEKSKTNYEKNYPSNAGYNYDNNIKQSSNMRRSYSSASIKRTTQQQSQPYQQQQQNHKVPQDHHHQSTSTMNKISLSKSVPSTLSTKSKHHHYQQQQHHIYTRILDYTKLSKGINNKSDYNCGDIKRAQPSQPKQWSPQNLSTYDIIEDLKKKKSFYKSN